MPILFYTINLMSLYTVLHHLSIYAFSYVESWELNPLKAHRKRLTSEQTMCVVRQGGVQGEWLFCSLWQVKALDLLAFASLKVSSIL